MYKKGALFFIVVGAFILGSAAQEYSIFPFNRGYFANTFKVMHPTTWSENGLVNEERPAAQKKPNSVKTYPPDWLEAACKNHARRFSFFAQGANKGQKQNIFFGDSVAEGLWSELYFDLNYTVVASGGLIMECLDLLRDTILRIKPNNIVVYIGGNDADLQGRQNPEEVAEVLKEFIIKLRDLDTNVVIHGIHGGTPAWYGNRPQKRDQEYTDKLNALYQEIARKTGSHYIPPFGLLDFSDEHAGFSDLSYDGEHLTVHGYYAWLPYIDEKLPPDMPPLFK